MGSVTSIGGKTTKVSVTNKSHFACKIKSSQVKYLQHHGAKLLLWVQLFCNCQDCGSLARPWRAIKQKVWQTVFTNELPDCWRKNYRLGCVSLNEFYWSCGWKCIIYLRHSKVFRRGMCPCYQAIIPEVLYDMLNHSSDKNSQLYWLLAKFERKIAAFRQTMIANNFPPT